MILQLLTWGVLAATSLAECVTWLRNDGIGVVVGYRLFSNGSLGVVDNYARLMIFDSSGSLFYKENLNLPNDPERVTSPYRLSFAIIADGSNELWLLSGNLKSFRYSAGVATMAYYGYRTMISTYGMFMSFPDYGVKLSGEGPGTFAVDINNELQWTGNQLNTPLGSGCMFNISYVSRSSANPLLNEFYIVIFSNKTFIGSVDPATKAFVPDQSTAASYTSTEPSYLVITASIGGNTDHLAFAGYYRPSASHKFDHYLRVKNRASSLSVSLLITDYHIWSVALDNSTATKMYFLTHDGSLYSATFSASSIDAPTLMVKDLFVRYAGLEIISSTKLLLRTIDSVAVFDIPTSTFKFVVDIKPTGGRHFGSKMFVLTHNFNVNLYEIAGNLPVRDNSFNYVGKVKELIVNTVYNRFYILTTITLYTFSLTTYSQLASLSLAQIQTLTGATIVSFNDIAPLALQPSKLLIIAFGIISGNLDTVMLVLNDINLAYLTHRWTGLLDNFLSVSVADSFNGFEYISLYRPNYLNAFYYHSSNNSFQDPLYSLNMRAVALYNRPEIANMRDVLLVSIPSGDRQLPRTDLIAGRVYKSNVQSNKLSIVIGDSTLSYLSYYWIGFNNPYDMMVQRIEGNLNKTIIFSGTFQIFIQYPNFTAYHLLLSEDIVGGIGYQKPDDTLRFFKGDHEVTRIDPLECYADPTKGYQNFDYPCFVPQCKYCNAFNANRCLICNAGLTLSADLSACLTTCNPAYALNGKCYADCPIEYYKYNANLWTCDTASVCTGSSHGNKLILGDRCSSVSSCPSGSTQNASRYCTFASTNAADSASTFVLTLPCGPNQYYFPHYSMCVSDSNPFYVNYTRDVSSMTMYCDESTHFYDIASKRCLMTCSLYSGKHPQMGLICVLAANCIAMGMFTDDTTSGVKLCTSTCSASLWTNLITKKCEGACTTPSAYSIAANRTCLSEASCLAAVGFGLLSVIDSACVSACGPTQYLITASKKCVSDTDCWGMSYLTALTTRLCQPTCLANEYIDNVAHYCYTKAECSNLGLLTKAASPTSLCKSACSASDYLDNGQKSCATKQECTTVNGKFVIGSNMTCVSTCPASLKFVMSGECVSSCPAGYYFEERLPDCVSKCAEAVSVINPIYCLRFLTFRIASAEQKERDSVVVILEVYFESNSTSTVTSFSVELATLFKQVGIVTDTSINEVEYAASIQSPVQDGNRVTIEFTLTKEPDNPYEVYILPESDVEFKANAIQSAFRNESKTSPVIMPPHKQAKPGVTSKLARGASQALFLATKLLTPLMMSTFMGLMSGSYLCMIGQTYSKLVLLPRLNFKLEVNEYSEMYYNVFRDFLEDFNEELMIKLVGTSTVQKNKQYVCEAGLDKLCYLTVEDNLFMSQLLSLIILAGQAVIVYLLALIFKLLKRTYTGDILLAKLKNILVYAFLLENNIQFWFTLLLNALIFVYNNTVLAAMKIGGHVVFVVMLVFLGKILSRRDNHYSKIIAVPAAAKGVNKAASLISHSFESVFERFRALLKEITVENRTTSYLKSYFLHDLVYSIVLVPGKYLGNFQMVAWLVVEVALFVSLLLFRPFSTRALNNRQIGIEFLFMWLLMCMTLVPHLKNSGKVLGSMILILSMIILLINLLFALIELVKVAISLVKYLMYKQRPSPQSARSQDALVSNRVTSPATARLLGRWSKDDSDIRALKTIKRSMTFIGAKSTSAIILKELDSKKSKVAGESGKTPPNLESRSKLISIRQIPRTLGQVVPIKCTQVEHLSVANSFKNTIKPRSIGLFATALKHRARGSNDLLRANQPPKASGVHPMGPDRPKILLAKSKEAK